MKTASWGLFLALILTMICVVSAFAATGTTATQDKQDAQVSASQSAPKTAQVAPQADIKDKPVGIMTQAQADSLRIAGDSLMAQSGVKEVKVGVVSTTEIIYILVIVLLAVVIIRVIG